jgi:hypothetical protein
VLTLVLVLPLAMMSEPDPGEFVTSSAIGPLLAVLGLACVAALSATSLHVTIADNAVVARFGVLGLPRFRYDVDTIASARTTTISRWATPGVFWTHRDGLRFALRGGPGVRLVLHSGRRVTIGVTDARAATRALERAGVAVAEPEA